MDLETKYHKYLSLLPAVQDRHGFIESHECDSLLFTGLTGCVPEVTVGIYAAFDQKTGMWHRRPTDRPCFDCKNNKDVGSKSSISRDMLLGLAWYAWHNKRLDISEQVIKHALTHWGFMGCAINKKVLWGRCQIMPALFATFCWISYRLGGPSRAWARWIPADLGHTGLKDYQAHLQVLHILLRRELSWHESKLDKAVLNYHASRQPRNPLFLHAVGRDIEAIKVLEDEKLWPSDRLPRRSDRKAQWLPMRDEGPDWEGELHRADLAPHSGGDFLFLYWLIYQKYEIKKN